MKKEKFDKMLEEIPKPMIPELKHQDMIAGMIVHEKRKNAAAWWWIAMPLYVLSLLMMKSFYFPQASTNVFINDFISQNPLMAAFLFVVSPLFIITINIMNIKKLFFYSGSAFNNPFLKMIIFRLFLIIISFLILVIYIYMAFK